jgi:hypothetical protein
MAMRVGMIRGFSVWFLTMVVALSVAGCKSDDVKKKPADAVADVAVTDVAPTDGRSVDVPGEEELRGEEVVPDDLAMDTEMPGDTHADVTELPVPTLAPMDSATAVKLAGFVRGLKTVAAGGEPTPVAWAFVNWNCQERALALEYAIATADPTLEGEPPLMDELLLTPEHLEEVAANPAFGVGAINVTGPLVAEQIFVRPDGTDVEGEPYGVFWTYHHAAAVNVDGTFKVMDLSVGDEPLAIDEWLSGFVEAGIECPHLADDAWWAAWVYWNSMTMGFELPPEPEYLCGYTITPMFTTKWDQEIQVDQAKWTPSTMETQFGGFVNVLKDPSFGYDYEPAPEEVPLITSRYTALPFSVLCEWNETFPWCD